MNILPALKLGDKIVTGETCHADAIRKAIMVHHLFNVSDGVKGFMIDGSFYNRADAARIVGVPTAVQGLLHSEDLHRAGLLPMEMEMAT